MNWKEFIKPDWRKILALAILIGILFLIPIEYKMGPRICDCDDPISCAKCSGPDETIVKTSLGIEYLDLFFSYDLYRSREIMISAPMGLIPIIGVYIFLCVLFSVYDKFKPKG